MGVKELKVLFENKPYRLKEYESDMYVAHSQDVCHDLSDRCQRISTR